jgi:hypothetical protein
VNKNRKYLSPSIIGALNPKVIINQKDQTNAQGAKIGIPGTVVAFTSIRLILVVGMWDTDFKSSNL